MTVRRVEDFCRIPKGGDPSLRHNTCILDPVGGSVSFCAWRATANSPLIA
jgi:hypothetical protein